MILMRGRKLLMEAVAKACVGERRGFGEPAAVWRWSVAAPEAAQV